MAESPLIPVNNSIYEELGERWYTASDDPVALLRAENRQRNPWILQTIRESMGERPCRVLDIGCGAGFLTNELARHGHESVGLDSSSASLAVARKYDSTGKAQYLLGDATQLPFEPKSYDGVCAMDFLEHVEDPEAIIREASRVLRPGGLFFFHTFNRNFLSWLIAIKGVEWFVRNTPRDMHVLRLFIKPRELSGMCVRQGLEVLEVKGSAPVVLSRSFFGLLVTGIVDDRFQFRFTRSTLIGYSGVARKLPAK